MRSGAGFLRGALRRRGRSGRTTALLAVAYPVIAVLGLGPRLTWLYPALCLAVLILTGELWLRALVREPVEPVARLGLATAAGLVTLPLIAMLLHVSSVRIEGRALAAGLAAVVTLLGAYAIVRERKDPIAAAPDPRPALAVAVPLGLALVIGGSAVLTYQRLPHPPEPGYTSVALNGWAAEIRRPVAFPARGLAVPIRVSSAGLPPSTVPLRVQVGDRVLGAAGLPGSVPPRGAGSRALIGRGVLPGAAGPGGGGVLGSGEPVAIAADATRSVAVFVPAPPDGCLHLIRISLGAASTVFYGHGPAAC